MKEHNNLASKEFLVYYNGMSLPFKLFTIEYIMKELEENKDNFGPIIKIENASKKKISDYYKKNYNEYSRFLHILSFLSMRVSVMVL